MELDDLAVGVAHFRNLLAARDLLAFGDQDLAVVREAESLVKKLSAEFNLVATKPKKEKSRDIKRVEEEGYTVTN